MALSTLFEDQRFLITFALGCLATLTSLLFYLFQRPRFPENAPPLTPESWPVLGSLQFFTERWDFWKRSLSHAHGGNFSFYAGQHPVVAVASDEARKVFFESKGLGFGDGYSALLGGSPQVRENNNPLAEDHTSEGGFGAYFNRRIIAMMKGNRLAQGLPQLIKDARGMLDDFASSPGGITNPFESIYRMVFKLTMRTVACNEIANDPALLAKTLRLFEEIESTASPLSIMFPWMPTPSKFKRMYSGSQLYMILKRVVDNRKKEDRREDDALQYLIDQGDSITDMITFVLGALFAAQLNSGINAAWVLVYITGNPYWLDRVREEVEFVADRYCPDQDRPLKERLMQVPIEAWEGEFPIIDICLKDSIRLQLSGAAFRRNISGADIPLNKAGTEVVPKDAYVALAAGDSHYNPKFFKNPDDWDPSRYMPDRAEDKNNPAYAWFGWGVGRHPCLGMRFAKLEINIIVAFFLAYFHEITLSDEQGRPTGRIPPVNRNRHTAHKPDEQIYLKYKFRTESSVP